MEEVLLSETSQASGAKLNDFLRNELGGRGVVQANKNVFMKNFVVNPERFIDDAELLGAITALPSYKGMACLFEENTILMQDEERLYNEAVTSLKHWRDFEKKDMVSPLTRGILDAALGCIDEV
ncbi:retrotransposon hot spot protein (RHS) [Trypanosoma conorhini]|uniref:Retrotransposon hot spot protein (RHS) n=1 Tax=Trypanosoma conorhini TaxID=83891 RepID=A0A3R7NV91_9TRYP|nr:retrotransposon hot spot protein (RHS) [Trypanosoma conorhini]RNF27619.1 retrotransposon hot spot protein (RHS) [Trypanosoma conorhini]